MLSAPMDVLKLHPIRKKVSQKEAFRKDIKAYVTGLGYDCTFENVKKGAENIVIGNPETAKYLITAHYDTPSGMLFPNFVTPCSFLIYILYQFLVIGLFIGVSVLFGAIAWFLSHSEDAAKLTGITVYWIVLLTLRFGPANKNNANDNTSGIVTLLEIARTLLPIHRDKVCFVLFDLEEAGLVGSKAYRNAHKNVTENQIVFNMDCVGDGDHIIFFPTKKAKKDDSLLRRIYRVGGWFGQKNILLKKDGLYFYPSDQKNFPVAFAIGAFSKKKFLGYYYSRIHTSRDTVLEETNVNLLRAAISTIVSE